MPGQFEGKVALVTGAGSGIGRASAITFAHEGAQMVVADIATECAEETVRLIEAAGGEATFAQADVSVGADTADLVAHAVRTYGRLDYAHNNAGVLGQRAKTADCSEEEWDRIIGINLKGVWLCMRNEIPRMLESGGGAIVNTASVSGVVGVRSFPAYVASKHGVAGLTKAAALDYARAGIRVNAVCPGFIDTPLVGFTAGDDKRAEMLPMGRLGTPQEVAEAVVWLCSDAASYVTGHTMLVDGGMTAE